MTTQELQQEEKEVLTSIYEGDTLFKEVNDTTFQYKIGEDGTNKSFLLEVIWGENYPEEMPDIHLNTFYNKHIQENVKSTIVKRLMEEGDAFLGCAMTYSLFEYAKENADELMMDQPEAAPQNMCDVKEPSIANNHPEISQKKEKTQQLTKSQKRRLFDRFGHQADRPRGWDWVDVVKHLSQTGSFIPEQS